MSHTYAKPLVLESQPRVRGVLSLHVVRTLHATPKGCQIETGDGRGRWKPASYELTVTTSLICVAFAICPVSDSLLSLCVVHVCGVCRLQYNETQDLVSSTDQYRSNTIYRKMIDRGHFPTKHRFDGIQFLYLK